MTDKKSVTVTIYKNEYTLKGDADAQHIVDLAKYVDTRMTEMGQKSSAPADKIAILVSMNIADELQRMEKKSQENLKLIESLEKNLEEYKTSSDNALKNAASLNEQTDGIRVQLSQEKEKNQAFMELKEKAESRAEGLEKQVEALIKELEQIKSGLSHSQGASHEMQIALDEQKEKAQAAEGKYEELKKKFENLEVAFLGLQEELKLTKEAPVAPSASGTTISDDRFHFLIKKIETVLE